MCSNGLRFFLTRRHSATLAGPNRKRTRTDTVPKDACCEFIPLSILGDYPVVRECVNSGLTSH